MVKDELREEVKEKAEAQKELLRRWDRRSDDDDSGRRGFERPGNDGLAADDVIPVTLETERDDRFVGRGRRRLLRAEVLADVFLTHTRERFRGMLREGKLDEKESRDFNQ
jgi:hypothetical protein